MFNGPFWLRAHAFEDAQESRRSGDDARQLEPCCVKERAEFGFCSRPPAATSMLTSLPYLTKLAAD